MAFQAVPPSGSTVRTGADPKVRSVRSLGLRSDREGGVVRRPVDATDPGRAETSRADEPQDDHTERQHREKQRNVWGCCETLALPCGETPRRHAWRESSPPGSEQSLVLQPCSGTWRSP